MITGGKNYLNKISLHRLKYNKPFSNVDRDLGHDNIPNHEYGVNKKCIILILNTKIIIIGYYIPYICNYLNIYINPICRYS